MWREPGQLRCGEGLSCGRGSARAASGSSSPTPTSGAAPSRASASYLSWRRPTSCPTPAAVSTVWTTACSSGAISTRSSTAAAWPTPALEVSRRIREDFEKGRHYYALHAEQVREPTNRSQRPSAEFLRWHNEEAYMG